MSVFWWSVFWEFWQNLPVIVLFVIAVWLWARKRKAGAIGCALVGAICGSLIIRFTETMPDGGREAVRVTVTNLIVLGGMQIPFMAYLGVEKEWSNYKTDLLLGAVAGLLLATSQGLATPDVQLGRVILHAIALAVVGAMALVGVRLLKTQPLAKALLHSLLITVTMTLVISLLDYGYRLAG